MADINADIRTEVQSVSKARKLPYTQGQSDMGRHTIVAASQSTVR